MNEEMNNSQRELMREWKPVMIGIGVLLVLFAGFFIYHNTQKNKDTAKTVEATSSQVKENPILEVAEDDCVKNAAATSTSAAARGR